MTTASEVAIATLTRLRDDAWEQSEHFIDIYRTVGIAGALVNHNEWKLRYETLDAALQDLIGELYAFQHGLPLHGEDQDDDDDDGYTDAEADAYVLASAGYGTDEDYGYYGDSDY